MAGERESDAVARDRIEHVVVLMLENRSFDHLLGYLDHPHGDPPLHDGQYPNPKNLAQPAADCFGVTGDAQYVLERDPPHGHASAAMPTNGTRWRNFRMNGFVAAYNRKLVGRELNPVVHWDRMRLLAGAIAPLVALALEELVRLPVSGGTAVLAAWLVVMAAAFLFVLREARGLTGQWKPLIALAGPAAVLLPGGFVAGFELFVGPANWLAWAAFFTLGAALLFALFKLVATQEAKSGRVVSPPDHPPARAIMRCITPEKIPVLATLAREFALCTQWYSSVPGATWPNRNFVHAATSQKSVDIEIGLYNAPTIFGRLTDAYQATGKPASQCWRIYHDGMAQAMAFSALWEGDALDNWHTMESFFEHAKNDDLPAYTFIEPCHGGPTSNSQHPGNNERVTSATDATAATDFQRSESLVRSIYDALAGNRDLFDKTLLVITYDEHGGLFDHEPPPRAAPPRPVRGGNHTTTRRSRSVKLVRWFIETQNTAFNFRCLGVRVPAVVVSPWIAPGKPDETRYDHTSIIATVRKLFAPDSEPLTRRDRAANDLLKLVTAASKPRETLPTFPPAWDPAAAPSATPAASVPPPASAPTDSAPGAVVTVRDPLAEQLPALAEHVDRRLTARVATELAATGAAVADEPIAVEPTAPIERSTQVASRFAALAPQRRTRSPQVT